MRAYLTALSLVHLHVIPGTVIGCSATRHANMIHQPDAGFMLVQRRRRWPNTKTTLVQRPVSATRLAHIIVVTDDGGKSQCQTNRCRSLPGCVSIYRVQPHKNDHMQSCRHWPTVLYSVRSQHRIIFQLHYIYILIIARLYMCNFN